jgi:hypothetical protein
LYIFQELCCCPVGKSWRYYYKCCKFESSTNNLFNFADLYKIIEISTKRFF